MIECSYSFDQWQSIMDALPPEQEDLERMIYEAMEDSEAEAITIELSSADAATVHALAKEVGGAS